MRGYITAIMFSMLKEHIDLLLGALGEDAKGSWPALVHSDSLLSPMGESDQQAQRKDYEY